MSLPPLTFVTGNARKLAEVQAILSTSGPLPMTLTSRAIDLPELQGSIEEIARAKCADAARIVGGPVLVEDTALCFGALGGLPGAYVKFFLEAVGAQGLHTMVQGFDDRSAEAVCTFALGDENGVQLFQGRTEGMVVAARTGEGEGFGWDPVFQPVGQDVGKEMTFAEMAKEEKNLVSHRFKALDKLRDYLKTKA